MYGLHMIIHMLYISCTDVVENQTAIGFKSTSDLENLDIQNAIVRPNGIELRQGVDGGAFIKFAPVNTVDDWSFEIDLELPSLHYPEFAGVYLWYLHDPKPGDFKGISSNFHGMVAGVEVVGTYLELALGASDGTLDARQHEDVLLMRDAADPVRFRGVKDLTVKVISTGKNFKMEVCSNKELLYDGLRYLTPAALGDLKSGKQFAITAHFENTPTYKKVLLSRAQCYERSESADYDPLEIRAPRPDTDPRLSHDIGHGNSHVRHLLANLEHFTAYMRAAIGDPTGMSLLRGMGNFSRAVVAHDDALQQAVEDIENDVSVPYALTAISQRLYDATAAVEVLEEAITRIHKAIPRIEEKARGTYTSAAISAISFMTFLFALVGVKHGVTKLLAAKKR